jgi:hypothetical protein
VPNFLIAKNGPFFSRISKIQAKCCGHDKNLFAT